MLSASECLFIFWSRAKRRVFVLSLNASTSAQEIEDVWNIKIKEQLIYFVKHHADEVLNMIETFRQKHDVSQKLLKMSEQVKKRLRTILKMIFIVQQKEWIVHQVFNQERERAIQLQNEIYVLKKQFVNEKNFNALINFLKNFIEFFFQKRRSFLMILTLLSNRNALLNTSILKFSSIILKRKWVDWIQSSTND